jgi:hypothetical protein
MRNSFSQDDSIIRRVDNMGYAAGADKESLLVDALVEMHVTREDQPSGVWPTGSPSTEVKRRFDLRTQRRHTYHTDRTDSPLGQPILASHVNTKNRRGRALSGSFVDSAMSVLAATRQPHTGGGSSLRAGIVGPSNRVQPTTCAADELDCSSPP